MKSILKRSSSGVDFANIVNVKVLSLDKGAGPESLPPPPTVPYLNYPPPYMYPYPHVQMPVPPPPVTIPKVKNVTEIKKDPIIEKDESLIASVADGIQREAESCFGTTVVEENWEEKHKLLLDEFIRQEEESKFNLSGQEDQVLQSFLTSNKCRMERAGKNFEKKAPSTPQSVGGGSSGSHNYFPGSLIRASFICGFTMGVLHHPGHIRLLYSLPLRP